jgi:hypothetical protein
VTWYGFNDVAFDTWISWLNRQKKGLKWHKCPGTIIKRDSCIVSMFFLHLASQQQPRYFIFYTHRKNPRDPNIKSNYFYKNGRKQRISSHQPYPKRRRKMSKTYHRCIHRKHTRMWNLFLVLLIVSSVLLFYFNGVLWNIDTWFERWKVSISPCQNVSPFWF